MNENRYTTESKPSTLSTMIKTAGILGLGYLAYKKRDTLQNGLKTVKDKTVSVGTQITNNVKHGANQFQDYIQNKTQDANAAISSLGQQIEDKYHSLQGEGQEAYLTALKGLNDKISNIKNSTQNTINNVKSTTNDAKGSVADAVKSAKDKVEENKPNIISDADHKNISPHNDLNHLKSTQH